MKYSNYIVKQSALFERFFLSGPIKVHEMVFIFSMKYIFQLFNKNL